jgi:hypothetical protein
MDRAAQRRVHGVCLALSLLAGGAIAGCANEQVHPGGDDPEGLLESPTHEADSQREGGEREGETQPR